jgi:transposase
MATKLVNPNAAGIDVASNEHVVAVPEDKSKESVRTFKGFTRDLHQLAKWLLSCKVETIAMESTGVYWFDLYTILLDYGFEVYLVNAHHVKNVPGRKSDVMPAGCSSFTPLVYYVRVFSLTTLPGHFATM